MFSYQEVGGTKVMPVPRYNVDRNRVRLGQGKAVFARAAHAIRDWRMFQLGWVETFPANAAITEGTTVVILVHLFACWSLNAARIVYVIDQSPPLAQFGFAYGTLADHAERGEERFTVEWRGEDDSVWYDLFAFSRPNHPLARMAYPLGRRLQKRFARDSLAAMVDAVAEK